MYERHFGLKRAPFSLTPDTGFFFPSSVHQQALNVLVVALKSGEGFMKITGEVGTGKTLLCRRLLNLLDGKAVTAYIPNPDLDAVALRRAVAREIGADVTGEPGEDITEAIHRRLLELAGQRRRVVLCIDEAQALPDESLEGVRLLTNLETERTRLLQIVLFGQPELDQRLALPGLRQLLQRVTFDYRLRPFDRKATVNYVHHRLRVAGGREMSLFTRGALHGLHTASGGTPRLVNVLAHKAMLAAYGEGASKVRRRHVRRAIEDTASVSTVRPASAWRPVALGVAAGVLATTAIAMLYGGLL